jgi:hypothetical protein
MYVHAGQQAGTLTARPIKPRVVARKKRRHAPRPIPVPFSTVVGSCALAEFGCCLESICKIIRTSIYILGAGNLWQNTQQSDSPTRDMVRLVAMGLVSEVVTRQEN